MPSCLKWSTTLSTLQIPLIFSLTLWNLQPIAVSWECRELFYLHSNTFTNFTVVHKAQSNMWWVYILKSHQNIYCHHFLWNSSLCLWTHLPIIHITFWNGSGLLFCECLRYTLCTFGVLNWHKMFTSHIYHFDVRDEPEVIWWWTC